MMFRGSTTVKRLGVLTGGLVAAAFLVGAAAPARAQGLAELAKKEQERRKKVPAPKKVYTNKDLPAQEPAAPATASPTTAAAPAAEGTPAAAEQKPAGGQRDEAWWRNRISVARDELRRNEVFLEALQSRVNALSSDFVNRDDPYQRAKIGEERQKALYQIDQVRKEIDEDKKLIEDIEEEARKAGVPPGWLR